MELLVAGGLLAKASVQSLPNTAGVQDSAEVLAMVYEDAALGRATYLVCY
jgi:thiazole synthase ThiGH ThiG subunit